MTSMADIFDIERYAVEDGPGIRSVVFFKGCNLRCKWCQNPESHRRSPEVMFYRNECIACGRCIEACSHDAVSNQESFGFITNPDLCTLSGACVEACFTGAREIVGRAESLESIMSELLKDESFYRESGGGVTFSGGEALLQAEAVKELARRCREQGIHTALETAGAVSAEVFKSVLPFINHLYFDLKHIDSELHQQWTGVPLNQILENLKWASETAERLIVRIPVVPGVNFDEETLRKMFTFIKDETKAREVELLPFHRLGQGKYDGLGREYAMKGISNLGIEDLEPMADIGRRMGLTVRSGGGGGD